MKTETFTDPDAFLRALHGKPARKRPKARDARPDIPRAPAAARGDGERLNDLYRLAALGYTLLCYDAAMRVWFVNVATGETTPAMPSYREALAAALRRTR